jgi:sulfopyruvate decarboxylase TPP-binding subunit
MSVRLGIPYSGCPYESEVLCSNEAEAVAFGVGAWLGGEEVEVFMQDAGFLLAMNNIIGLVNTYGIDIKILIKFVNTPEHHRLSCETAKAIYDTLRSDYKNYQTVE